MYQNVSSFIYVLLDNLSLCKMVESELLLWIPKKDSLVVFGVFLPRCKPTIWFITWVKLTSAMADTDSNR